MSDGFLLRALAVADADTLVVYPDSVTLRKQLPLFLGAAHSSCCYSFALTDDTGSRLYVYVLKEGATSFCAVTAQEQQTPLFALLASLIQLAAADASAALLQPAVQLLCGALLPPSVGTALRVMLPLAIGSVDEGGCLCQLNANAPAGQLARCTFPPCTYPPCPHPPYGPLRRGMSLHHRGRRPAACG